MTGIIIYLFSVFISSCSQILLKKSANKQYKSLLKEYLNLRIIIAYTLFFSSTILSIIAYRYIPLSTGTILETSGYIFVAILGFRTLNEKFSKKKCIGLIFILTGIIIFNL